MDIALPISTEYEEALARLALPPLVRIQADIFATSAGDAGAQADCSDCDCDCYDCD